MKSNKILSIFCMFAISFGTAYVVAAPQDEADKDRKALVKHFKEMFPEVSFADHKNGLYAFDEDARAQAEEINVFPPYEFELEKGEQIFNKPFANGKGYVDCIKSGVLRERSEYPYFDTAKKMVKTIELEINECRKSNNEKPLKYKKGDIAALSAHIATRSAGKKINVKIPNQDALNAYRSGKEFYYSKRGYLNNSCANCHIDYAGKKS